MFIAYQTYNTDYFCQLKVKVLGLEYYVNDAG